MTLKEFADKLNGVAYLDISDSLVQEAKESGIVIVSGCSDDLCEFDGALYDEFGCYEGGIAYLDSEGYIYKKKRPGFKYIEARWCKDGVDGFAWTYNTDIPHEDFEMFDEGEKYCRGFVFYLKDLKETN